MYFRETTLPIPQLRGVIELVQEMPERKVEYDLEADDTPDDLVRLSKDVSLLMDGQPLNTAITKRYDSSYESAAYEMHKDPDRFKGRIALLSLDNSALLFRVHDEDQSIRSTLCRSGTLVLADAAIKHWVTPPLQEGPRHFVFFGCDAQRET